MSYGGSINREVLSSLALSIEANCTTASRRGAILFAKGQALVYDHRKTGTDYKVEFKNNPLLLFEIETIRKKRNKFVHSFFTEYADQWALSTATSSQLNEMIRELDKLHTLIAGFARRLELLGAKEKPKWDAITKAFVEFGKARGWELPDEFKG